MPYTVAHKATLELGAGLGNATNATVKTVRHNDVIVKLGFSREGKERLLYEYRVYERLAQRGVGHVPCVLGMFQGMDVGGGGVVPSVLVMTDDGEALSAREGKVRVSPTEKYVRCFENTMQGLTGSADDLQSCVPRLAKCDP